MGKTIGLATAIVLIVIAAGVGYFVGHDKGEKDAIRSCEQATSGLASAAASLILPKDEALVTCRVSKSLLGD